MFLFLTIESSIDKSFDWVSTREEADKEISAPSCQESGHSLKTYFNRRGGLLNALEHTHVDDDLCAALHHSGNAL